MRKLIPIIVMFMLIVSSCTSKKEVSELQEKCARWATEFFEREFKSPNGTLNTLPMIVARGHCTQGEACNFQAHYNEKLNKCFVYVDIQAASGKPLKSGAVPMRIQNFLYDAYERVPYGVYEAEYDGVGDKSTTNCWAKDKKFGTGTVSYTCKYEHEFLDAIRPYLTE